MNHFDYFHKAYGDPVYHINNYKFFLHVEATCVLGAHELELCFHYRLDEGNVLEIIIGEREENNGLEYHIIGRFQLHEPFYEGLLKRYIREYIRGVRAYYGLDYDFHESAVMSESDLRTILDDIRADELIAKYKSKTKWAESEMYMLCQEHNLQVFHTGEEDHLAECMCPSKRGHRISINLSTGSWFCGYCRKNGGLEELRNDVNQWRQIHG